MSNNLQIQISDWLTKQGYPLEMKVAAELRKEEFFVNQSPYYSDPETGTNREIDIIATKTDDIGFLEVSLVIECKKSEKPWILFTAEGHDAGRNSLFTFGILSELARHKLVDRLWENREPQDPLPLPWFKKVGRTAFGITSAFGAGEDLAYKAVIGSLKASIAWDRPNQDKYSYKLRFIFPVVVFEGRLFEAYLDENNNMVVKEIEEGFLTNTRSIDGSCCCSVHILTDQRLQSFCKEASELTDRLLQLLGPDLQKMYEEEFKGER